VHRNIYVARGWFDKAVALNNTEAKENLKRLEEVALLDSTRVALRRMSCVQTCATLHRSYVNSVCEHFSAIADGDKPERTKCVDVSLTTARRCRDSCREWAPGPWADNKCVTCFQVLIACSITQEPPDNQSNDKRYTEYSKDCLAALADCTAGCRGQAAGPSSAMPMENPN
jgi:hypothetical protein